MKPRHSILPLAVMAIGTTGCFETQRDETFADSVVHDDTEIRVLHASPDAPRLDLLLDGERKLEDLDYGQTRVLTPPGDWYEVAVEGRTGPETLEPLLSAEFDRFDEGRGYDVLLAGRASEDENSLRAVFLARDEQEPENDEEDEDDESPSVRGVHLVESESAEELDLFINGNEEPLTMLGYGESSEMLELDEGVVSIRLQKPGSDGWLFDSGKRERFSAEEELLVAVVPNTSASADETGGSPVKVLILNEDQVTTLRNETEQSSARLVHAAADFGALDVTIQTDSGSTAVFGPHSVDYQGASPSADPLGYGFLENSAFLVGAEPEGEDVVNKDVRFRRGHGRTLVALNDAEGELDLKSAANNDRSVATNARVRVFNGSEDLNDHDHADAIDVYLLAEGQGLAEEDGVVESPAFASLNFRKMSRYEPVPAGDYDLVVTRAGDTEQELLRETLTVEAIGIYDLILSGDGTDTGEGPFQLIEIGGASGL